MEQQLHLYLYVFIKSGRNNLELGSHPTGLGILPGFLLEGLGRGFRLIDIIILGDPIGIGLGKAETRLLGLLLGGRLAGACLLLLGIVGLLLGIVGHFYQAAGLPFT
jgi:hypothetical protein